MSLEERVFVAEALNRAFFGLMRRSQSVDLITLIDELRSHGTLELVGGLTKISRLVANEEELCH